MKNTKREIILATVSDMVADFVYYDRKEDIDLSMDDLNQAIKTGEITVDEICDRFKELLKENYTE